MQSRYAQVKLWLAQGDLQAADRWAASQEQRSGADERFRFENELTHITQSRVLIAQERFDEAIGLLSHLEETARSAGRMGRVVEILLLEAFALGEMGDSEHAILALTECLTLAEPSGYVRIFLDEGQPMQRLLAQWLAHAGASPLRDYVIHLLSQYEAERHTLPTVQEKVSLAGHLVEPLSQRELEVLGAIAAGLTNKEIAQKLFISLRTVKYHTTSIFNKLNVNNRAHAAARARELGLLK